jgi:hypothetical protein
MSKPSTTSDRRRPSRPPKPNTAIADALFAGLAKAWADDRHPKRFRGEPLDSSARGDKP